MFFIQKGRNFIKLKSLCLFLYISRAFELKSWHINVFFHKKLIKFQIKSLIWFYFFIKIGKKPDFFFNFEFFWSKMRFLTFRSNRVLNKNQNLSSNKHYLIKFLCCLHNRHMDRSNIWLKIKRALDLIYYYDKFWLFIPAINTIVVLKHELFSTSIIVLL